MSRWVDEDTPNRRFARAAREVAGADPGEPVAGQGKQLSLFPKKDVPRLQPHQASPRQFAHLPGIQWHGNYDESEVSRPHDEDLDLFGGMGYTSGGVHSGTKRAAKDIIDWHGPFSLLRHLGGSMALEEGHTLEDYDATPEDHDAEVERRGGRHGYLHPVLPHPDDHVPGRGVDQGDHWGEALGRVNGALRREVAAAEWNGDYDPVRTNDIRKGLRYQNQSEHPGHISTLTPISAPLQHSDYVRMNLRVGTDNNHIHPETLALFRRGVLDKVEAQKYNPTTPTAVTSGPGASDSFRKDRTQRARRNLRSHQFDQTLPMEGS